MEPKVIQNTLFNKKCACCQSEEINLFATNVDYLKPVYYSTTEIQLSNTVELWRCQSCKSVFIQNAICESDSINLYSFGESSKRWNNEMTFFEEKTTQLIKLILPYLTNKEAVLDIGCSTGRLLDFAKINGSKQTFGIEFSIESQNICVQKGHLMINEIADFKETFDTVFAFDLIEHTYNVPGFLSGISNALKKDGILIVLTGNPHAFTAQLLKNNWWYYCFPEHVVFPSKQFYANLKDFDLVNYAKVYNGKSYTGNLTKLFFKLIYYFRLNGKYIGLPSFVKDHHLVILRKHAQK
ncbi:MAG: class I SAM-dependent methyltransferase [Cytophagales bacterium]